MAKLLNRNEVLEKEKWDLKRIYESEAQYEKDLKEALEQATKLEKYQGKIKTEEDILDILEKYEELKIKIDHLSHYVDLDYSVDMGDEKRKTRSMNFLKIDSEISQKTAYIENEIADVDDKILDKIINAENRYSDYIKDIKRRKPHLLDPKTKDLVEKFSYVLSAPYRLYLEMKLSDMNFEDFELSGKKYENSFVLYENHYQYQIDTDLRRKAFKYFSKALSHYKNTFASVYDTYLQAEKTIAKLKGFDSLKEYHLFIQDVDEDLYNRQLDVIMEELSKHMRKYVKILKKLYKLDEVRFSDMKLPIEIIKGESYKFEDSKPIVKKALQVMGDDYLKIAMSSFDNRWVDYALNRGKSTGGFCASPYKKDGFILMSWTGGLDDLYTLVHEIGHGVHFHFAQAENSYFSQEPSLYIIEAPSTMNEVLLSKALLQEEKDDKKRAQIVAAMISNTYYHNFVTHFLEAYYQREVYKLVDSDQAITEPVLSKLFKDTLKKFFGDELVIDEGAELTWMRQPHYYSGLYSYTYSAGLTIGTLMANKIYENKESYKDWIEVLKLGGKKNVVEMAKTAGINIKDDKALRECIDFVGEMIDLIDKAI